MKSRYVHVGETGEDNGEGVGTFRATFVSPLPANHSAICRPVPPNAPWRWINIHLVMLKQLTGWAPKYDASTFSKTSWIGHFITAIWQRCSRGDETSTFVEKHWLKWCFCGAVWQQWMGHWKKWCYCRSSRESAMEEVQSAAATFLH